MPCTLNRLELALSVGVFLAEWAWRSLSDRFDSRFESVGPNVALLKLGNTCSANSLRPFMSVAASGNESMNLSTPIINVLPNPLNALIRCSNYRVNLETFFGNVTGVSVLHSGVDL